MTLLYTLIALFALILQAPGVRALEPDEILSDPALEARAREISAGLRCLVCQNQSIDDSDADLARDLRVLVRERLTAGASNQEVLDFVVERYGTFVLLKPPVSPSTYLLWMMPLLLVLPGLYFFWRKSRFQPGPASAPKPLSATEQQELDQILRARDL